MPETEAATAQVRIWAIGDGNTCCVVVVDQLILGLLVHEPGGWRAVALSVDGTLAQASDLHPTREGAEQAWMRRFMRIMGGVAVRADPGRGPAS